MRKLTTIIAVCAALCIAAPAIAEMPLSIGAGSVGYGLTGPDKGEYYTHYWGGLKGYTASEHTASYVTYQHLGRNGGVDGDGVKALLISGTPKLPGFYLLTDIGVAFALAEDADGSYTAAFSVGGGIAYALTEYISPFVYLSAYDEGPRFTSSVHFGLAITDIQKMVTKKK